MSAWRDKLRHAFAVDPPGPVEPTPQEQEAVERFCQWFARRHWSTPSVVLLETIRPLNYVISQGMHFFAPGVSAIVRQPSYERYGQLAEFLERRGSIEYLARRIEQIEQDHRAQERQRHDPPGGGAGPLT